MVIQKGSDLVLELSVKPSKIRVYTTDPKAYVEITDFTDNKAYINADELRMLSSGVIAYTYYIDEEAQPFDDNYYNSIGTIYTDYYLQDTEENGEINGDVQSIKDYVDKVIKEETKGLDEYKTKTDSNTDEITKLDDELTKEINRATSKENSNTDSIKQETERATSREDVLEDALNTVKEDVSSNENKISNLQINDGKQNDRLDTIETELKDKVEQTELSNYLSKDEANAYQPKGDYVTKKDIPTKTSQLINDSGYITDAGSEFATKDHTHEVTINGQTKVIDSTSAVDLGTYATASDVANKQDKLVSGTNIKTINNISLLGSGNINIQGGGGGGGTANPWLYVKATVDTAIEVDGNIVELKANKGQIINSFSSLDFCVANYPNPKYITDVEVHCFNPNQVTKFTVMKTYKPSGEQWVNSYGVTDVKEWDLSLIDVSNLTSVWGFYNGKKSMATIDLRYWDTSNIKGFSSLFENCTSLTTIKGIEDMDTSSATSFAMMFRNCSALKTLDVTKWNTSKVTNTQGMFNMCDTLTALDLSTWNTSKLTNITTMFYDCTKLASLNMSGWDTSSMTSIGNMFLSCYALKDITFGEGWGKWSGNLTLDLSTTATALTDNTYNTILTFYDRAANGLGTSSIKFKKAHTLPSGFTDTMTSKGYNIVLV